MRILIYIEPFPLHQTMDHYKEAAAAFARMLVSDTSAQYLSDFDIRIYANRETLAYAQDRALAAKRFFLSPESREQDQFRTSLTEWPVEGVRTWTQLLRAEGDVTAKYREILEQIHGRFAFDLVVTLGDNGAAKSFAASANIDHMVLDASFARPSFFNATVFDPSGTGSFSLLSQVNISTIKALVGKDAWTAKMDQSCVSELAEQGLRTESLGPIDFTGQDRILRRGSARAALLCLQNFDDPLFCAHSKFRSPVDLIETCLPELSATETLTMIRPPRGGSEGLGQADAIRQAKKAADRYGDKVLWLDRQSERTSDARLFTLCDLVVTANDAAGLEATLFDKPVCVLGSASYKPIGTFPKLSAVLARHFDPRSYLKNIAALRAHILRARLVDRAQPLSFDIFADRIAQTLAAWQENEANPKKTLEDIHARYAPKTIDALKNRLGKRPDEPAPTDVSSDQSDQNAESTGRKLWNTSVSHLTSRARQSLGLKLFQSGSSDETRGSGITGVPLFTSKPQEQHTSSLPLPNYPLRPDERRLIEEAKASLKKNRKSRARYAVVAHFFYQDATEEMLQRLLAIEQRFDLYATVPALGSGPLKAAIRNAFPIAKIITLPNRGHDLWPFCFVLSQMQIDKYERVLKLLTTKPHFEGEPVEADVGAGWQDYAMMCLLGDNADSPRTDDLLDPEGTWSLAGPDGMLCNTKDENLPLSFDVTKALDGLDQTQVPTHWFYFCGGMYWLSGAAAQNVPPPFSQPEHYTPGTFNTTCEMRILATFAIALAAHQTAAKPCTLTPDDALPAFNAQQNEAEAADAIRHFMQSGFTPQTA